MCKTDEVATIFSQKLIANKIEWSGHVAAAIDVGMKLPLVIDQEAIDPIFLANQPKLLNRSRLHFFHPGNDPATQSTSPFHPGLISEKKKPSNDKSKKEEAEKQNRKIDS